MADFYISLRQEEIASQIADLINRYNQWYRKHTSQSILCAQANYFIEVLGPRVIGCAGSIREYPTLSKIIHVCTVPEYRGRGIAKKLVELAVQSCDTEYVYMTIREDNFLSRTMAKSLKFRYVKRTWFRDHYTLVFGRRKDDYGCTTSESL